MTVNVWSTVDDRQPIFHRVAGNHEVALPAREVVAGLILPVARFVDLLKFERVNFGLADGAASWRAGGGR